MNFRTKFEFSFQDMEALHDYFDGSLEPGVHQAEGNLPLRLVYNDRFIAQISNGEWVGMVGTDKLKHVFVSFQQAIEWLVLNIC